MAQAFVNVSASTKLQDSLGPIMDRDKALQSNFSGTGFPAEAVLGQLCFREDDGRLYTLRSLSPVAVWEPLVDATAGDQRWLRLTGGVVAGPLMLDATQQERQLGFNLSAQANRSTYFFGNPANEIVGLYSQRSGASAWTYDPVANTLNVGAANFTKYGHSVWHAGNDGAGSGLDADLLDGQDGTFYRNWNNLLNIPAFQDGAFTSVAAIRAGVDLGSRVSRHGDYIPGNLGIQNGSPTLFMLDTDQRSAMLHVNDGHIYLLRGTGISSLNFEPLPGRTWPLDLDMDAGTASFAGDLYTSTYGWLHDRFAHRSTAWGSAGTRYEGNCGDKPNSSGWEVFDIGNGQHQLRQWVLNCTNCNCNCNCTGGGNSGSNPG